MFFKPFVLQNLVAVNVNDSSSFRKVIAADDIDILVILSARTELDKEIYSLKLGKQKYLMKCIRQKDLKKVLQTVLSLFIRFYGMWFTSSFYNKPKKYSSFWKLI